MDAKAANDVLKDCACVLEKGEILECQCCNKVQKSGTYYDTSTGMLCKKCAMEQLTDGDEL